VGGNELFQRDSSKTQKRANHESTEPIENSYTMLLHSALQASVQRARVGKSQWAIDKYYRKLRQNIKSSINFSVASCKRAKFKYFVWGRPKGQGRAVTTRPNQRIFKGLKTPHGADGQSTFRLFGKPCRDRRSAKSMQPKCDQNLQ